MANWWNYTLSSYQQVLFIIAAATTLIMLVQIIMTFIGAGDDPTFDGVEADGGGDVDVTDSINDGGFGIVFGMRVISVRSALAFFAIGSWVTFTFCEIMPWWGATLIGFVAGVGAAFLIAFVIKSVEKLQSSGNVEAKNAIGKTGEVYLTVPAKGEGSGKVNILVQERLTEFSAVTEKEQPIKTGTVVKVTGLVNDSTLIVE